MGGATLAIAGIFPSPIFKGKIDFLVARSTDFFLCGLSASHTPA